MKKNWVFIDYFRNRNGVPMGLYRRKEDDLTVYACAENDPNEDTPYYFLASKALEDSEL